jgi:type II secretory ATPase GspE/PulE/Tfp pilus assembly ATPase PilB-like protein
METMLDDAKIKILQGLTTAEEVLRVVATEVS